MPKYNKQPDDQVIKKSQKTNSGIYVSAGDIKQEYETTDWITLQKDYEKMRESDTIPVITLEMLKFPILQAGFEITSKNKEVEDYGYWIFDSLYKGINYLKYHKLLCLDYGLSMHEMIIKRNDKCPVNNKITNRPLYFNPIQLHTIMEFHYDEQMNFTGIKHERIIPDKGSDQIEVDKDSLHWLSFKEEFNDIRGRSILRPIRLVWDLKLKTLIASGISIQKGAGITLIGIDGNPGSVDEAKAEQIGRTIAQMQNGYVSYNKAKMSIEILEPKLAQHVLPMLEYYDKTMFMNTMSQFMISGIAQNGSRAATSEHKSSYELSANYVLSVVEANFQDILDKSIEMGCLYNIKEDEWPIFKSNSITQADLKTVASNIQTLVNAGLVLNEGDKKYIREVFGLPDLVISEAGTSGQEVGGEQVEGVESALSKGLKRKVSLDVIEFENKMLDVNSVNAHYDLIVEKTKALIDSYVDKFIKDIFIQLNGNKDKNILIKNSLQYDLISELKELYNIGFEKGQKDILNETRKINTANVTLTTKTLGKSENSRIERSVKKLFWDMKNAIESEMERMTTKLIEMKGGLSGVLNSFKDGFKGDKNLISVTVEGGYIDGRGQTLNEMDKDIKTYIISVRLDKHLCNECAPFDGLIVTRSELEGMGLKLMQPVNPGCLGKDNCRCIVLAYQLR